MERIRSLYLHIPFCTWVCKYCDFTAYPVLQGMIPSYLEALLGELKRSASRLPLGPLETVFIGGGTPSLLGAAQVSKLMGTIEAACGLACGAEVTLEANPSNVTVESAEGWLAAGVNRLSVGVQSLDERALRFLERLHSGDEALAALRAARRAGFENLNADLIYGIPGLATPKWLSSLEAVVAEGPTHISSYELTVEPSTRLAQEVRRGLHTMPEAEAQLEQYWAADRLLGSAGFTHYEISNWARAGRECRHNLAGWTYRPYLGLGAGAHSMLRLDDGSTERRWNVKGLRDYISRMTDGRPALAGSERLDPERARGEAAMIGVRLLAGTFAAGPFPAERARLRQAGLLRDESGWVQLTPRGVELANQVGAAFLR
jgi:oxygen-independent coproporphyrinogen III oxidase